MNNEIPEEISLPPHFPSTTIQVRRGHPFWEEGGSEVQDATIGFAPRLEVDALAPQVDQVLEALGHPEAFITDESLLADFLDEPQEYTALSTALGVEVREDDRVIDLARRLR